MNIENFEKAANLRRDIAILKKDVEILKSTLGTSKVLFQAKFKDNEKIYLLPEQYAVPVDTKKLDSFKQLLIAEKEEKIIKLEKKFNEL